MDKEFSNVPSEQFRITFFQNWNSSGEYPQTPNLTGFLNDPTSLLTPLLYNFYPICWCESEILETSGCGLESLKVAGM